jgi:hypothetical protein
MAFKIKHPFKFHDTTNNQRTLGRDGRVISPLKQNNDSDARNPMRPIYSNILNKGQEATLQDVIKLPDPRNPEEYDASVSINPNLNQQLSEWEKNNPEDVNILDKVVQLAYNNPGITDFLTTKFPKLSRGVMDLAMQASGGGADSFNLNEAVNKYFGRNLLNTGDEDSERSLDPREEYKGSYQTQWRPDPLNINKAFLGDIDPRLKPSPHTAKSEKYPWLKGYSVKGDDFDKGLDEKVNWHDGAELAFTQIPEDTPDEEESKYYDEFANRTRRQNMPYFMDYIMRQTPEYKQNYADKSNIDSEGYFQGVAKKNNLNKAFNDLYKGKTFYGSGEEDGTISNIMGVDYGGMAAGLSTDDKLPYASVQDVWDFNVHGRGGYNNKWAGYTEEVTDPITGEKSTITDPRIYQRAQLLNRGARALGGGGLKLSDRFYFTPDEYRDYIPDKDIEFMQEFYDIHDAGGGMGSGSKPIVINAGKKKK